MRINFLHWFRRNGKASAGDDGGVLGSREVVRFDFFDAEWSEFEEAEEVTDVVPLEEHQSAEETSLDRNEDSLESTLQGLRDELRQHCSETASMARAAFDALYGELRQYKENFLLHAQRPLFLEITMLLNRVTSLRRYYEAESSPLERNVLAMNLEGLEVDVEEILLRRDISRIEEGGERLNRKTQKAIQTIETLVPEEDMLVVERLKAGFMMGDKVFRPEEVVVKKYVRDRERTG